MSETVDATGYLVDATGYLVDATGYLIIEGQRRIHPPQLIFGAKTVRLTQGKPSSLMVDQVAVKVTIRIPAKAFDALQPEAVVIIPEELIQHPVAVEAVGS